MDVEKVVRLFANFRTLTKPMRATTRRCLLSDACVSYSNSATTDTPMPLNKDWREFLELLNSNEVEYLVVGAFAVAFHGYPRYTADLDLMLCPTEENAHRVVAALSKFGFASLGIRAADLCVPGMVVQLGVKRRHRSVDGDIGCQL